MIGVFDSGLGGLTVVKKIFEYLPDYQVVYFGDTARTPYGGRGPETIKKYALEDLDILLRMGAQLIVVACNTASAVAFDELIKKSPVPILEVITPAVEQAIKVTKNKKIGILGTRATVNSGIYQRLIAERDKSIKVFAQAAPLLVPFIEEGQLKSVELKRIIRKYLWSLKQQQVNTLILGCTHYPFIKKLISLKIGRRVNIIDPSTEVVLKLKEMIENDPNLAASLIKSQDHKLFVSDLTGNFVNLSKNWLKINLPIKEIKVNKGY
ncbi:MAG: glutamate racemase [Patescibacteria group bacterium]